MKKSYQLVEVKWLDAEAGNTWKTEEEFLSEDAGDLCTTVAFLVRKPSKRIPMYFLASSVVKVEDEVHFNNTIKIPDKWVKSVKVMVEDYTVIESV